MVQTGGSLVACSCSGAGNCLHWSGSARLDIGAIKMFQPLQERHPGGWKNEVLKLELQFRESSTDFLDMREGL